MAPHDSETPRRDERRSIRHRRTASAARRVGPIGRGTRSSREIASRIRRRRAVATIEMILVFPMLLTLAFGMVEFAQYFQIRAAFSSAARDAARVACTSIAAQADPSTAATKTLGFASVAFNSSWMTIVDDSTNQTVTDVSTITSGHAFTLTIQSNYSAIPAVVRPLHDMTGAGIGNGKVVVGKCTMIKE